MEFGAIIAGNGRRSGVAGGHRSADEHIVPVPLEDGSGRSRSSRVEGRSQTQGDGRILRQCREGRDDVRIGGDIDLEHLDVGGIAVDRSGRGSSHAGEAGEAGRGRVRFRLTLCVHAQGAHASRRIGRRVGIGQGVERLLVVGDRIDTAQGQDDAGVGTGLGGLFEHQGGHSRAQVQILAGIQCGGVHPDRHLGDIAVESELMVPQQQGLQHRRGGSSHIGDRDRRRIHLLLRRQVGKSAQIDGGRRDLRIEKHQPPAARRRIFRVGDRDRLPGEMRGEFHRLVIQDIRQGEPGLSVVAIGRLVQARLGPFGTAMPQPADRVSGIGIRHLGEHDVIETIPGDISDDPDERGILRRQDGLLGRPGVEHDDRVRLVGTSRKLRAADPADGDGPARSSVHIACADFELVRGIPAHPERRHGDPTLASAEIEYLLEGVVAGPGQAMEGLDSGFLVQACQAVTALITQHQRGDAVATHVRDPCANPSVFRCSDDGFRKRIKCRFPCLQPRRMVLQAAVTAQPRIPDDHVIQAVVVEIADDDRDDRAAAGEEHAVGSVRAMEDIAFDALVEFQRQHGIGEVRRQIGGPGTQNLQAAFGPIIASGQVPRVLNQDVVRTGHRSIGTRNIVDEGQGLEGVIDASGHRHRKGRRGLDQRSKVHPIAGAERHRPGGSMQPAKGRQRLQPGRPAVLPGRYSDISRGWQVRPLHRCRMAQGHQRQSGNENETDGLDGQHGWLLS